MNFFRHCYLGGEGRDNLLYDFSHLGWYDIKTNDYIEDQTLRTKNNGHHLYWQYDNTHRNFISAYSRNDTHGSFYHIADPTKSINNENCGDSENLLGGHTIFNHHSDGDGDGDGLNEDMCGDYYTVFFIPLKDNGFLVNVAQQTNLTYYGRIRAARALMTPRLTIMGENKIEDYPNVITDNGGYSITKCTLTYIGVAPTLKSAINEYIYLCAKYKPTNPGIQRAGATGDFTYGSYYNDLRPFINYSRQGDSFNEIPWTLYCANKTGDSNNPQPYLSHQCIDFNPNICVLSKLPYDNGFIDNMYLMTTCPNTKEQGVTLHGDFFSFNGRNFINLFGNLVLELPGY